MMYSIGVVFLLVKQVTMVDGTVLVMVLTMTSLDVFVRALRLLTSKSPVSYGSL